MSSIHLLLGSSKTGGYLQWRRFSKRAATRSMLVCSSIRRSADVGSVLRSSATSPSERRVLGGLSSIGAAAKTKLPRGLRTPAGSPSGAC